MSVTMSVIGYVNDCSESSFSKRSRKGFKKVTLDPLMCVNIILRSSYHGIDGKQSEDNLSKVIKHDEI